jgi:hypothetical protein
MRYLWVATVLWSLAWKCARWRLCTARQRCLKSRSPAVARDVLEDCLSTAVARTFVTQIWTGVIATFQQTSTSPGANVFGFNALVDSSSHSQWLELAFCCLPFNRLPLPCTAPLTAFVSTTVHGSFASSQTLWRFNMTHGIKCVTTTSAGDLNCKKTGQTFPGVTYLRAQMTAV